MTSLAIVSPFLNEAGNAEAYARMSGELAEELKRRHGIDTRFVLVDDGSTDGGGALFARSMSVPTTLLTLSRNFGKEVAVLAGLDAVETDLALIMDVDLQHTREVALELVDELVGDPDTDCVYAVKVDRRQLDGWRRAQASGLFYRLINFRQRFQFPPDAGDFRVMRRPVVDALVQLRDKKRFNKGLYAWAGFNARGIAYAPEKRVAGTSAWSRLDLLAFTAEAFTSFSPLPLRFVSGLGLILALSGVLYGLKIIVEVLIYGISVPGFPSVLVATVVLGGFNLALVGLLGEYVWTAVSEAKERPVYLLRGRTEIPGKAEATGIPPAPRSRRGHRKEK